MSVSGISSSNFLNQNIASTQNQQQATQQQFLALAQELQSGNLSQAQTTALQQQQLQSTAASSAPGSAAAPVNDHVRAHFHHHLREQPGDSDSAQNSSTPSFGQLGQPVQSGSASSAQQAYGLQQDLQQVALNSDLINAQSALLQESGLSLTA